MTIPESVRARLAVTLAARLAELEQEMGEIRDWLRDNTEVASPSTGTGAVSSKDGVDEARRAATSKRMKRYWAKRRKAKKAAEAEQVQVMVAEPLETETLALLKGAKS